MGCEAGGMGHMEPHMMMGGHCPRCGPGPCRCPMRMAMMHGGPMGGCGPLGGMGGCGMSPCMCKKMMMMKMMHGGMGGC